VVALAEEVDAAEFGGVEADEDVPGLLVARCVGTAGNKKSIFVVFSLRLLHNNEQLLLLSFLLLLLSQMWLSWQCDCRGDTVLELQKEMG
jgi:hypothetical protein